MIVTPLAPEWTDEAVEVGGDKQVLKAPYQAFPRPLALDLDLSAY